MRVSSLRDGSTHRKFLSFFFCFFSSFSALLSLREGASTSWMLPGTRTMGGRFESVTTSRSGDVSFAGANDASERRTERRR